MIKNSLPFFLHILKVCLLNTWLAQIWSFDFEPKTVYFELKF